jgi:hypothetical protein
LSNLQTGFFIFEKLDAMIIGWFFWMDAINQLSIADKMSQMFVETIIDEEVIPK